MQCLTNVPQGQATFLVSSAILSMTAFQTSTLTGSDRFKTLLVTLLLRLLNPLLLFTLSYLCWLKVNAWIQCKLFCLNCKVFTTNRPACLHNLFNCFAIPAPHFSIIYHPFLTTNCLITNHRSLTAYDTTNFSYVLTAYDTTNLLYVLTVQTSVELSQLAPCMRPHNPQSGNRVLTCLGNSGLCWTVFTWNRETAMHMLHMLHMFTLFNISVHTSYGESVTKKHRVLSTASMRHTILARLVMVIKEVRLILHPADCFRSSQ